MKSVKSLKKKGYSCGFDQSYFRKNEHQIDKVFSYDLLAKKTFKEQHTEINLHVECKYRKLGTKWLFIPSLPEFFDLFEDTYNTNWLCYVDHFNQKRKFELEHISEELGPVCEKGIQITDNDIDPNSIPRAMAQLSYSLAGEIKKSLQIQTIRAINDQEQLFNHIPVIFTTAQLYRMKEGTTTKAIIDCKGGIEEIADKMDILVISNENQPELRKFNEEELSDLIPSEKDSQFNNIFKSSLGRNILDYPKSIVVVNGTIDQQNGFCKLEKVIEKIVEKDPDYTAAAAKVNEFIDLLDQGTKG